MILGKISIVDVSKGLQLIIDGETEPTTKKYSYLASFVPADGDRVVIEEIGGSYVVMGKIITEKEMAGIVQKAAEADHAEKADQADKAAQADKATQADSADKANLAAHSETSSLAEKATNADKAAKADNATSANYASKATDSDNSTKATQDGRGMAINTSYGSRLSAGTDYIELISPSGTVLSTVYVPYAKKAGTATSSTNADSANKAKYDELGHRFISEYGARLSISGRTLTLYSKQGNNISSVTLPS